jgi:hypothetical protein
MHALSEKIACALPLTQRAFSWARIVLSHSFSSQYLDNGKTPPELKPLSLIDSFFNQHKLVCRPTPRLPLPTSASDTIVPRSVTAK